MSNTTRLIAPMTVSRTSTGSLTPPRSDNGDAAREVASLNLLTGVVVDATREVTPVLATPKLTATQLCVLRKLYLGPAEGLAQGVLGVNYSTIRILLSRGLIDAHQELAFSRRPIWKCVLTDAGREAARRHVDRWSNQ